MKYQNLVCSVSQMLLLTVSNGAKYNIVSILKQYGKIKKSLNIIYNIVIEVNIYIVNVKILQYLLLLT